MRPDHIILESKHQMTQSYPVYYVGVDVGTGSARAALVDKDGQILGLAEKPITRNEIKENHITQSSTEIWEAICYTVQTALSESHVDPAMVLGIGFDATCSLVAINESDDSPVAVGPDFNNSYENIILWMDHRAEEEVAELNVTGDPSLKYVGGGFSIEMELPKMKWLKNHMPEGKFSECKFYDLADYLTHKATGKEDRSFCSCVCKQGFVPDGVEDRNGWSAPFLTRVGVPELAEDNFRRLGGLPGVTGKYNTTGETVGALTKQAAKELGLTTKCYVGSGVIDAYAGWIGTVAANTEVTIKSLEEQDKNKIGIAKASGRLAAIAGTSTCHIVIDEKAIFVPGVWGPYRDVIGRGFWCAEGGQSCTGALLAHVLSTHPAYAELGVSSEASGVSRFDFLNSRLETLRKTRGERSVVALCKNLFFYGDFHGNRSPIADPHMRASITGQSMDVSLDSLSIEYLGACEFIAQQTRQIVERMEESGYKIQAIYMSGGQCRNGLLMRLLADCTGLPIVIPRYIDASVVFGAAMLGAVAAEDAIAKEGLPIPSTIKQIKQEEGVNPPSPYTAPTATSSTTSISALAGQQAGYPFPVMTPLNKENVPTGVDVSEDEDEEGIISFNSKSTAQKTATNDFLHKENVSDKLWRVMCAMSGMGKIIFPQNENDPDRKLLSTKYKIFLDQIATQQKYRKMVAETESAIEQYLKI